jgi:hypothetical protein
VGAFAAVPAVVGIVYSRTLDPVPAVCLVMAGALWASVAFFAKHAERANAALGTAMMAFSAVVGWMMVAVHLASPAKDLAPFIKWAAAHDASSPQVYVLGLFDETIRGIVPFVAGRPVVHVDPEFLERVRPAFVLVHTNEDNAVPLDPAYEIIADRKFGPSRYLALWQRRDHPTQNTLSRLPGPSKADHSG